MALGNRRILAVLPCGAGKTVIFAYMAAEHVRRGGTVHFYVHRRELLDQARATFKAFGLSTDGIYIGMVQRRSVPLTEPSLIIFDEAHHASATTWRNITDRYPNAYVVGLTATPHRTNGGSLSEQFDVLCEGVGANWLIEHGYLAPYDYYAPSLTTVAKSDILIGRGADYDGVAVGDVMLRSKIYGDVARYIDPTRKTIIYAPSVELSMALASELGAVHVDGTTPSDERTRIIDAFRRGDVMLLTNVDLFGEGFDVPDCEVVILLRPTKSTALFIQQTMRALRYQVGKRATIYDLVGNVFTHGLPTDYEHWALEGTLRKRYEQALEVTVRMCERCYRVYGGNQPICPYCKHDNGKTQAQIKQDQKAELERIEAIERTNARREVGMARTYDELYAIALKRNYKNPSWWANKILKSRRDKL